MVSITSIQYIRKITENQEEQCLTVHGGVLFTYQGTSYSCGLTFLLFTGKAEAEGIDVTAGDKLSASLTSSEEVAQVLNALHELVYVSPAHRDVYEELFKKHETLYARKHSHDPQYKDTQDQ